MIEAIIKEQSLQIIVGMLLSEESEGCVSRFMQMISSEIQEHDTGCTTHQNVYS